MTISERIFHIMEEKHISQTALSERTGISQRTISDWKRKKTNPGADKIISLCRALEISSYYLLTGESGPEEVRITAKTADDSGLREDEQIVVDYYNNMSEIKKKRLIAYMQGLSKRK
ncbi:MAG: helix-turn-helix transcriptional regulator [Eubacteriales bacterium]|nr:helix-turn-helix transcriptional regulator [Eubacteriales bacterium]